MGGGGSAPDPEIPTPLNPDPLRFNAPHFELSSHTWIPVYIYVLKFRNPKSETLNPKP